MKFKPVDPKQDLAKVEEKILKFWEKNKIFEKSINQRSGKKEFVFYDGPPFATGLPHYGHIVPGTLKDIIPRYWTMKGYKVERRFGWDCHGLPIEYQLEKELGIGSKKEIEKMGIDKFNEKCRSIVLRYVKEWERIIPRLGRWADFKNDYKTMDPEYMESIWWVFKSLWDKGLIYEGYKSLHICPRCVTPLSNFEVTLGYKEKKDPSVVVKFSLENEKDTYVLAWTTTPWTLPGNVLLAVNPKFKYVRVLTDEGDFILAEKRVKEVFKGKKIKKTREIDINKLIGKKYKPLFPIAKQGTRYQIAKADFVSLEEGTGVVHIAPAFGEDDYSLGQKNSSAVIHHIDTDGSVNHLLEKYKGISVWQLNKKVIEELRKKNLLFSESTIVHSYPFCWRCETPLLNYATKSWFVAVTKIKSKLIKNNEKIYWIPANVKKGRFGKWLEGARDWAISRNRFWGTPIPVWKCDKTGEVKVIESIAELEKKTNRKITDLHLHKIKDLSWKNKKTGGTMRLSGEVLDCWFESGSMPYASNHYPFENKKWFDEHQCDFIAESIDQTRGWFYTLHVLSTAISERPAFKNVITNGVVLAEDGQKMSKSRKNFPDPMFLVKKYGADALRFYLMSSPVIKGEDLCFSEKGVLELMRNLFLKLWNVYRFFVTYSNLDKWQPKKSSLVNLSILDKWILTRLDNVIVKASDALEKYDVSRALSYFPSFINDLSTWYVRRSRDRIGPAVQAGIDKDICHAVLHQVLTTLSCLLAPFTPFISEEIYKNLTGEESIHLTDWPKAKKPEIKNSAKKLLEQMELVRQICELGHGQRKKKAIKVRQPLQLIKVKTEVKKLPEELVQLIKDELNIKEVKFISNKNLKIELDTKITPPLKKEGKARDLIRQIQEARKKANCQLNELVTVYLPSWPVEFEEEIKRKTLAKDLRKGKTVRIEK